MWLLYVVAQSLPLHGSGSEGSVGSSCARLGYSFKLNVGV